MRAVRDFAAICAGCKDTFRSTSGYMIVMNGGVVAYYSGRQSIVALCTAMAETIALAKLDVKVKHMRALSSGILYTWHKRVHTCLYGVYDMYVLCYSMYISYTP